MQAVAPSSRNIELDSLYFSEETKAASQKYAQAYLADYLRQMTRRGKHSIARAARGKARIAKRKAKRK